MHVINIFFLGKFLKFHIFFKTLLYKLRLDLCHIIIKLIVYKVNRKFFKIKYFYLIFFSSKDQKKRAFVNNR